MRCLGLGGASRAEPQMGALGGPLAGGRGWDAAEAGGGGEPGSLASGVRVWGAQLLCWESSQDRCSEDPCWEGTVPPSAQGSESESGGRRPRRSLRTAGGGGCPLSQAGRGRRAGARPAAPSLPESHASILSPVPLKRAWGTRWGGGVSHVRPAQQMAGGSESQPRFSVGSLEALKTLCPWPGPGTQLASDCPLKSDRRGWLSPAGLLSSDVMVFPVSLGLGS